jgi:hypothetical protein
MTGERLIVLLRLINGLGNKNSQMKSFDGCLKKVLLSNLSTDFAIDLEKAVRNENKSVTFRTSMSCEMLGCVLGGRCSTTQGVIGPAWAMKPCRHGNCRRVGEYDLNGTA